MGVNQLEGVMSEHKWEERIENMSRRGELWDDYELSIAKRKFLVFLKRGLLSFGKTGRAKHNWYWTGFQFGMQLGSIDMKTGISSFLYLGPKEQEFVLWVEGMIDRMEIKSSNEHRRFCKCEKCGLFSWCKVWSGVWFCGVCHDEAMRIVEGDKSDREGNGGFAYIFGSRDVKMYKIGASKDPHSRLLTWARKDLPFRIEMLHIIPADDKFSAENYLHNRFSDKRQLGEWFLLDDSEFNDIASIVSFENGEFIFGA